jgi:TFIIF-interacting CTD phosphatase-like protein
MLRFTCLMMSLFALSLNGVAPAQATTDRFNYQINPTPESTSESVIQQANRIAQDTADRAFLNPETTAIVINISGEQAGQISPLLILNVTREHWQRQQNVQVWANYPGGVNRLLSFGRSNSRPSRVVVNSIRDQLTEREANFYQ